ncbi:hypothetical protein glysoja_001124 [Glycine soja]|nr:hypothetical protein JHK87_050918 [Glycine soja]KHN40626.1 hypothetical protein glysoja_001124 [Glycine soja]
MFSPISNLVCTCTILLCCVSLGRCISEERFELGIKQQKRSPIRITTTTLQIKQNFTISFSLSHPLQKKKLAILQFSSCSVSFTTPNPHNTPEYTHN